MHALSMVTQAVGVAYRSCNHENIISAKCLPVVFPQNFGPENYTLTVCTLYVSMFDYMYLAGYRSSRLWKFQC